jgi:hypothetical protein
MDQRAAHLESDRVALLMKAATATKAYVDANPEPIPEYDRDEYPVGPVHEVSSGA